MSFRRGLVPFSASACLAAASRRERPFTFKPSRRLSRRTPSLSIMLLVRASPYPDSSALSFMVNAKNPIPESQMIANVKIAIGGGINEPRDALLTILYGLLTNPDQLDAVRAGDKWRSAFEEGGRWVAPIQASSRLLMG